MCRPIAAILSLFLSSAAVAAPLLQSGVPGMQLSVFATGLSLPSGMVALNDGSLIVGTTVPAAVAGFQSYYHGLGQLVRLQDGDSNGVADGPGVLVAGVLLGCWRTLRRRDRH